VVQVDSRGLKAYEHERANEALRIRQSRVGTRDCLHSKRPIPAVAEGLAKLDLTPRTLHTNSSEAGLQQSTETAEGGIYFVAPSEPTSVD
jgi:hypothetical protein